MSSSNAKCRVGNNISISITANPSINGVDIYVQKRFGGVRKLTESKVNLSGAPISVTWQASDQSGVGDYTLIATSATKARDFYKSITLTEHTEESERTNVIWEIR